MEYYSILIPGIISFFVYLLFSNKDFNICQTSDFKAIKMMIIKFKTPIVLPIDFSLFPWRWGQIKQLLICSNHRFMQDKPEVYK